MMIIPVISAGLRGPLHSGPNGENGVRVQHLDSSPLSP
jgi:hypothetical protein